MDFVLVKNNVVQNVIVADQSVIDELFQDFLCIERKDGEVVSPGDIYDPETRTFHSPS